MIRIVSGFQMQNQNVLCEVPASFHVACSLLPKSFHLQVLYGVAESIVKGLVNKSRVKVT